LATAAIWVFALPLALALAGSLLARSYWPGQSRMLIAALIGLTAGAAIASVALKFIRTTHTEVPVQPVCPGHEHH